MAIQGRKAPSSKKLIRYSLKERKQKALEQEIKLKSRAKSHFDKYPKKKKKIKKEEEEERKSNAKEKREENGGARIITKKKHRQHHLQHTHTYKSSNI